MSPSCSLLSIITVRKFTIQHNFLHSDQPLEPYKRPLKKLLLFFLIVFLFGTFLFWRLEGPRAEKFRSAVIDALAPSIEIGQIPGNIFFGTVDFIQRISDYSESEATIDTLRNDLKRWQNYALRLEEENTMLRKLVNFSATADYPTISASVLADTTSPFHHSVLLSSGRENGIEVGLPATDGVGVVGRITNVSRTASRLLLITDSSSRVPVTILPSGKKGIISGDNTFQPKIELLGNTASIEAGDKIVTNGDGGVFPPDFAVGTVLKGAEGRIRAILAADLSSLKNVSLVKFEKTVIPDQSTDVLWPRNDRNQTAE